MMDTGMRVCLPSATYTKFPGKKAGRKMNSYNGVTKVWNRTFRNFPVIDKESFNLGLGIPKSEFLERQYGFGAKNPKKYGME